MEKHISNTNIPRGVAPKLIEYGLRKRSQRIKEKYEEEFKKHPPIIDQISKNYSQDIERRIQFSNWIDKIASMEPEEREKYLKARNIDEKVFLGQYEEERKAVEGGEKAEPSPISDVLAMATPLLTIASMAGGGVFRAIAGFLGGGPITQEVADFLGSLVGGLTPGGMKRIVGKYGEEKAAKIIELLQKEMAEGGEQKLATLKRIIEEGAKEFKPKLAGQLIEHLSEETQGKLGKLFLDYDDSAIRGLKGFIKASQKEDFELAQKTHLENLSGLLDIAKKSTPQEAEILHNMIVDEFGKYLEVMTKKVAVINNKGKTVYRMIKQEFTESDLDKLAGVWAKDKGAMLDALDNIINKKGLLRNQKGSIDPRMLIFVKDLLTTENVWKAIVNAKLANLHVLGVKLASDAVMSLSQNIMQSSAIALKYGLNAGQRNFIAVMLAYKQAWPEAVKIAKASFRTGEPQFEKMLKEIAGKPVQSAIAYLEMMDFTEPGAVANWLGHWYAIGPRAVMTADQFAKVFNWRMELHTQAFYEALNRVEGTIQGVAKIKAAERLAKSFMDNLHENEWLFDKAKQGTYVRTFTDTTGFSRALTQMPYWVRMYLPFIRTKFNLFKEGMKFVPGLGLASYDVWHGEGLERSTTFVKQAVGLAYAWWVYDKVLDGTITGKAPKIRPKGYNAYSVHIGNNAYGYSHLGQIAEPTKLIADAAQAYANAKPDDKERLSNAIISAMGTMIKNTSVMPEIVNFVHALETAEYAKDKERAIGYFLGKPITGMIPEVIHDVREIVDPVYREARSVIDEVEDYSPGLSSRLPPHLDEDGLPQYLPPGVSADDTPPSRWSVALDMFSPITVKHDTMDDVSKAELKYGLGGTRIPNILNYQGQSLELTPQQQEEWGRATGHEIKIRDMDQRQYKQNILNDPRYELLPETDKDRYIKEDLQNAHRLFYEQGKSMIFEKYFTPGGGESETKIRVGELPNPKEPIDLEIGQ